MKTKKTTKQCEHLLVFPRVAYETRNGQEKLVAFGKKCAMCGEIIELTRTEFKRTFEPGTKGKKNHLFVKPRVIYGTNECKGKVVFCGVQCEVCKEKIRCSKKAFRAIFKREPQ